MYEQLKERIKKHEGFVPKIYKDSLGKKTIGYGHLITEEDTYEEGKEYSKEDLEVCFEKDFNNAVQSAKTVIADIDLHPTAEEVIIEMCFQLGGNGVSKFKNMWACLGDGDYVNAANEMLDSRWYLQTPQRAQSLSDMMKGCQL
jgi:lysozyme